jgi:hypothetical protein
MASPLRKIELEALEKIARGTSSDSVIDESILDRLLALGLTQLRGGKTGMTSRGTMELTRRKAVLRGFEKRR